MNNPPLIIHQYLGHASPSFFPYTHGGEYDIELDHFLDPETISDFLSTELSQTRGQGLSNSPGTADNQYVSQSNHEVPSFPFSDSHGAAGCSNNELQELEEAETSRDNRGNRRDEDQVKASGGYKSRYQGIEDFESSEQCTKAKQTTISNAQPYPSLHRAWLRRKLCRRKGPAAAFQNEAC